MRKANFQFSGGVEKVVDSEFSTTLVSGDLKPNSPLTFLGTGAGYYGLLPGLNLSFNYSKAQDAKSEEFNEDLNIEKSYFIADYYFHPSKFNTPFVGLGYGRVKIYLGGERDSEPGKSILVRGGWAWRTHRRWTIVSYAQYENANNIYYKEFHYYGGSADITYSSFGAYVGIAFNLFPVTSVPAPTDTVVEAASAN